MKMYWKMLSKNIRKHQLSRMRKSPAIVVLLSLALIGLAAFLVSKFVPVLEFFGAQGGEMVQLATSHVPTEGDLEELQWEAQQRKKEIIDMTGYW